ncbi:MAG: hypothetical protein KAV87_67845 [Desulfobacteraceae bacterium]|nr:hypothetical protein [Desulfobacteraceae bacterium]
MTVPILQDLPDSDLLPIDWDTIQAIIYGWVHDAFDNEFSVIWKNQNIPQPEYPYLSLLVISGPTPESAIDEIRNGAIREGEPTEALLVRTQGPRRMTLSISAHVSKVSSMSQNATSLLSKLQSSLGLKSTKDNLWVNGGLSIASIGSIGDTSLVVNGEWISRAGFDIGFLIASLMTEEVEFIESVSGTVTAVSDSGNTHTLPLSVDITP